MSINSPYSRDSGMRSTGEYGPALEALENWERANAAHDCSAGSGSTSDHVDDAFMNEDGYSSWMFMESVVDSFDHPSLPQGLGYYPALKARIKSEIGYTWDDIAYECQIYLECGMYDEWTAEDPDYFM